MKVIKEKSFEELIERLEEISSQLDSNNAGLEESLQIFEEGIKLTKECYERLNKAELKVTELKNDLEKSINIEVQQD
ncbi:MAG TPA: exodeoxyribonuclease VII small subunit [Melioribacteraceae bacterium]|nr:exodeoxyribonuclease VII small subunit [Melioribacteraceae bacterium]